MIPHPIYGRIGDLIRQRRKLLDLTQEGLAGQLGISRASLASIETGRQNILVHQLYGLASALNLNPQDFLPAIPVAVRKGHSSELPLPEGLSVEQRAQVTLLFEGGDLEPTTPREERHARPAKR
jgi:transcriptional regulator with XRE-family HTH domain